MAKKSSTKKSLKSLFSRSDANVKESAEKEEEEKEEKTTRDGGEKKRKFKLFKFNLKSRSNPALDKTSASARSSENRIFSDSEEVSLESSAASKSFYATAPRSKAKNLSFSELDLRKPRKFGTFSFGLRRKKRDKDREDLSKSAIGLHGPGAQDRHARLDLSQWELDRVKRQGAFATSQPELDTAETFDIPPPPPVAPPLSASQRCSSDTFLSRTAPRPTLHDRHGRLRSLETLLDSPDAFDVDKETGTPPIAVPELLTEPPTPDRSRRRDGPGAEKNAVDGPSAIPGGASSENHTAVHSPLPLAQPANAILSPVVFIKKFKVNSDAAGDLPGGGYSTDDTALITPTLPATAGSKMAAAPIKTLLDCSQITPINTSSPLPQDEGQLPHFPEVNGEPGASVVSSDRGSPLVDKSTASGEAYESVFSQSFTTEVMSAMPKPGDAPVLLPDTEEDPLRRPPATPPARDQERFDPESPVDPGVSEHSPSVVAIVVVPSTPDDACRTPASGDGDATPTNEDPRMETEHVLGALYDALLPLSLRQTHPTIPTPGGRPERQGERLSHAVTTTSSPVHSDPDPAGGDLLHGTGRVAPSEKSVSHSAVKPEELNAVENTEAPLSQIERPAPPYRNYAGSPETANTHTQVSLVLDRARFVTFRDNLLPSPEPFPPLETMAALQYQQETLETMAEEDDDEAEGETFSEPKGRLDGGYGEPVYISVGSDGSSAMDVYYSAEEDNVADGELDDISTLAESDDLYAETEDMYDMAMREGGAQGFGFGGAPGFPAAAVKADGRRENASVPAPGEGRGAAHLNDQIELEGRRLRRIIEGQQQATGRRAESPPPLLYSPPPLPEGEQQERGVTGATEPWRRRIEMWGERLDMQEEQEEVELPALPVQQVDRVMECEPAPPFSQVYNEEEEEEEEGAEKEEVWERWQPLILPVTEARPHIPSQVTDLPGRQYLSHKGFCRTETNAQHLHPDAHTFLNVSADLGASTADSVQLQETEEAGEDAASTASTASTAEVKADGREERSERSPARRKSLVILAHYTPVTVNHRASGADTTTTTSFATSSVFLGGAEPPDPGRRADPPAAGPVRAERTPVGRADEASGVHLRPIEPRWADLHHLHHPHPGPPPLPPPSAEMSSAYSSTLYVTRRGSPPSDGDDHRRHRYSDALEEPADLGGGYSHLESTTYSSRPLEVKPTGGDSSENRWRNNFNGVSQYKPDSYTTSTTNSSTLFLNSPGTSVQSSSLPEATLYTRYPPTCTSTTPQPLETYGSLGNRLSDSSSTVGYASSRSVSAAEAEGGGRSWEWAEPGAAPVSESEARTEEIKRSRDAAQQPVDRRSSTECTSAGAAHNRRHSREDDDDTSSVFTGVFKATRVDLITDPNSPTSPVSPYLREMEVLKDTLKSLGPTSGAQKQRNLRGAPFSALSPIVEDTPSLARSAAASSSTATVTASSISAAEGLNGRYVLPPDLGFGLSGAMDRRSPLDTMKQQQEQLQQNGIWGLNRPLRGSASNSIVMRSSFDDPPPSSHNSNGLQQSPAGSSRLDHSVLFSSYRAQSMDTSTDNAGANPLLSRSLYRASSLPDTGVASYDRISKAPRDIGGIGGDAQLSAYDRFAFRLNSSSTSGSLTGAEDLYSRISRGPHFTVNTAPMSGNSPQSLLSPTGSLDLSRGTSSLTSMYGQGTGVLGAPVLQRSFSSEGLMGGQLHSPSLLFNSVHGGAHFQVPEPPAPQRATVPKYRAFPDAYLTKEKEHGKLNPRPGKIFIFDRPGMCGQRIEVRSDVVDATSWDLQETISIRVVRGGWVLYEKPNFKGEKVALDEGDLELTFPFMFPEEEEVQQQKGKQNEVEAKGEQNGEQNGEPAEKPKPARKFIIGSLRRSVRDYSVPEISLFPEENGEGKKVVFRDTSEDARIFGFPIKAASIIINAGLWLVYAEPFFQGVPRVLEVGGFTNPAAWGVERPYVGSLHPLKIGEPRVENIDEPKMIIFDKPYFSGKSRTIHGTMKNFLTRTDNRQTVFMHNAGSLKVLGGLWVGYEKDGFRGHQYLLEEGDYHDWRVWGGCNAEMRSVKVIRADLSEPMMVMFEQPEDEDVDEENSFEVTEAIPDVALFQYKTTTRTIHVLSGAWVAYSHVDYSGNQYILEKGFYNNCGDWGSEDNVICSVQPILPAPNEGSKAKNEIQLYSESDFQGKCVTFNLNQPDITDKVLAKSCRLLGGSWVLHDTKDHTGNQCVLSEGEYPNLVSMGCPPGFTPRSLRAVPLIFSIPSISLFGLECLEGKEVTTDMEMSDLMAEGFNNHFLSVRVNSGCWVLCEYSNYRGRQFLLEQMEITNWPKFSSMHTIGSMYPVRQRRRFFRIKNKESGEFLCLHGALEEMKTGRVVVSADPEPASDFWFYDDGFLKNKMSSTMSLQVMGNVEPGSKVVLWTDTRQPLQTWTAPMSGRISSLTYPGMVLDIKGGQSYDKDYVVILPENEERASQQWELELL